MASEGRKFDLNFFFFSNGPRMCPEALGVALRVAKHLGTILTSLETVWDNLKQIEKIVFFNFLKLISLTFHGFEWILGDIGVKN